MASGPASPARRRPGGPPGRPARERLSIELISSFDPPREFRLAPDGRSVAFTAEAGGARQLFTMPLRGGPQRQVTASEKPISDPQWSPDGRRLAYVREESIWIVDVDGSRALEVTRHPAGNKRPRWAPDGRRIAFTSRRRGWTQVWLVDALIPRRGRPRSAPAKAEPRPLTPPGVDVEEVVWAPDGRRLAVMSQRDPDLLTAQVHVLDVESGEERQVGGSGAWETAARWLPDGTGLLLLSDADGWFQVARVAADGTDRTVLTAGEQEHGEPAGGPEFAPLPSPDGSRFVHVTVRDGFVDLVVAPIPTVGAPSRGAERISPVDGVWQAVDWLPDGSGVVAVGRGERSPEDLYVLPVGRRRAATAVRRVTVSLPAVIDPERLPAGERVAVTARDGLRIEVTLWRPPDATGRRGGGRVPAIIHVHGGPTWQAYRDFQPFRSLLVDHGMAYLSVDFRGSTGYGRAFRWANRGEWGHADVHDMIDAARWALGQPWCDGRLAAYGGSYGGYLTLCALVEEPALWTCGVDLFGDSEIAESYRHGDRIGRLDLERMMGRPDDPANAEAYRRGSPVYRAERIEAPLLILHGRKDKRVVPLMSERMVEALEIEDKHHQVHWYEDEGHGWERRENRRDAWKRILEFLKLHLLDEPARPDGA